MNSIMRQSFVKDIIKDLEKSEKRLRTKAAIHLRTKMKEKVSKKETSLPGNPPGKDSGDLIRGIMYVHDGDETKVGVGPPAYHAHLMEFGTAGRIVKNYRGHKGVEKNVGRVLPRPFVQPTFEEEAATVVEILSERWA